MGKTGEQSKPHVSNVAILNGAYSQQGFRQSIRQADFIDNAASCADTPSQTVLP